MPQSNIEQGGCLDIQESKADFSPKVSCLRASARLGWAQAKKKGLRANPKPLLQKAKERGGSKAFRKDWTGTLMG